MGHFQWLLSSTDLMQLQWFLLTSVTLACCADVFFTLANSVKKMSAHSSDLYIEFQYDGTMFSWPIRINFPNKPSVLHRQKSWQVTMKVANRAIINFKRSSMKRLELHFEFINSISHSGQQTLFFLLRVNKICLHANYSCMCSTIVYKAYAHLIHGHT